MELEMVLIRNGATRGGEEGRFQRDVDESLSPDGVSNIKERVDAAVYPRVSRVYNGPTRSCLETASLIYGPFPALIMGEMRPFDYGEFGGRTYDEILEDPRFLEWASKENIEPFPGGIAPQKTAARNLREFQDIAEDMEASGIRTAAVIAHRSAILLILNRYVSPLHRYFERDIEYGGGYTVLYDPRLSVMKVISTF